MKKKSKSLTIHVWVYLIILLVLILALLWIFQVAFFNTYYEYRTTKDLDKVANTTETYYNNNKDINDYDLLSFDSNSCIEIVRDNKTIYTSNFMRNGCLVEGRNNKDIGEYKNDFINSNEKENTYKINNPMIGNETLIKAIKLDDNTYAFINVSLVPTSSTINIIREELIYITALVLLLSFIFAYFISKRVSNPILKINLRAKKLALGDFTTPFETTENITEINELNDTLNYAQGELSKIDQTRKDLLANVSHDLKTPLTMIEAYAEMARDLNNDNEEKRKDNLNVIIDESKRLNVLVNDILLLSKNEIDMDKLNIEKFDITKLALDIIKKFDYLKEEGYKFSLESEASYIVKADKVKIEEVIYNLIGNAINYTGKDKKVIIRLEEVKKSLRVNVIDTGKGINKDEINKIWDKYYKNEKNHIRNKVGTGLGLSIVKTILNKHGYDFGVLSEEGKGSNFYFIIKEFTKK